MMSDVLEAMSTPVGIVIYFLGMATACLWQIVKARWLHRKTVPINWNIIGIIAGVSALVFVGIQNTQLAADVKACQREFNTSIREVRRINNENDELSIQQRKDFLKKDDLESQMWVDLVNPPPEIAKLEFNNPVRQEYGISVVFRYSTTAAVYSERIRLSQQQQEELKKEREAHPLPDPTCGK
jgi:type II secretory pathway pseudopilin PulG